MSDTEIKEAVEIFKKAVARLKESLAQPLDNPLAIDGTIQRFEFVTELCWKMFKKLLDKEGHEAKSPKQALQRAYQMGWVDDEKLWLAILNDRNLTYHTYDEDEADKIYSHIKRYYPEFERVAEMAEKLVS